MEQRELKFKVWDKEKKRMSTPMGVAANFITWNDGDVDMPVLFAEAKSDRFIFLQYIGKKDTNKKEMYEGDIIPCGKQNCIIVFGKVRLGFGYHFNYKTNWNTVDKFYSINGKDKVIGNIYENPELIP